MSEPRYTLDEARAELARRECRAHGHDCIASAFHEAYERLAPRYGYKTRDASAVPWADVPDANKRLMRAVARDLLDKGVIR